MVSKINSWQKRSSMKVGDKVLILRTDIFALRNRKNRNGIITSINGQYISVKPTWCKYKLELYPNEIKII